MYSYVHQCFRNAKTDNEKIFLVAGMNWGYLLDEVIENPVNCKNVVCFSHPHPQKRDKPWEPQWEKDWRSIIEIKG